MSESAKVKTCLWFESQAEEAAAFYVSLLPGSAVTTSFRPDPGGPALMVEFELAGTPYQALNGGPMYRLNEAASISVTTEDQAETDRLWEALVAGGGRASRCGWLVDRFGLSWQIVPRSLGRCLAAPDREAAGRAMQAMFQMSKIDIAAIEKAFRGEMS
ncbi:MAG: VOC family protein [Planctomycetes bacterium]|nr:VOC family protein [Planctomycetota bacterium]